MAWPVAVIPSFTDRTLTLAFAAVQRVLDALIARPHLASQILEGVSVPTGAVVQVPHKLGRKLSGWKLVRQRAQADVWDDQDAGKSPELFLYLRSSASVVLDLEVF